MGKYIIELAEEEYEAIKRIPELYRGNIIKAIANGTPYNPSGDCISREALRSALEVTQYNDIDDLTRTEKLIDNAPPFEINEQTYKDAYDQGYADGWKERYGEPDGRPKGKWIITREEQGSCGIIYKTRKCNKCGWEFSLVIPRNFCPECGADMRKGGTE